MRPLSRRPAAVRRAALATAATTALVVAAGVTAGPAAAADAPSPDVYGDRLADGWSDWSWGTTVDLASPTGRGGGSAISVGIDQAWAGLNLHAREALTTGPDTAVELSVRPERPGAVLALVVYGEDLGPLGAPHVLHGGGALPAGEWTTLRAPLSDLGLAGRRVSGFSVQDFTGSTGQRLDVDDLALTSPSAPPPPVVAGPVEVRPSNATQNATRGRPTDPSVFFGYEGFRPYYARVDGDFTGTTEEILAWATAKWGLDQVGPADLGKAMAVVETWWRQEHVGAHGELGILQVNPGAWPDSGPASWSTAYSADYAMAVVRHHYDGNSWLGAATRGNLRDSVAAWECGCPGNGWNVYATRVFGYLETKPWLRPGVPPEWF